MDVLERQHVLAVASADCPGGLACTEGLCEEAPDGTPEADVSDEDVPVEDAPVEDVPEDDAPDSSPAEEAVSCGGYVVAPSEEGRAFELTIDKLSTGVIRLPEGFTLAEGDSAAEGPCCAGGCCQ